MLKDAQRAADDLSVICHAIMEPGKPLVPCSDETRGFIAREAATKVIQAIVPAAARGVDIGAAIVDLLRMNAKFHGVDVGDTAPAGSEA